MENYPNWKQFVLTNDTWQKRQGFISWTTLETTTTSTLKAVNDNR